MKKLITAICFMFALSPLALAQDKAKADEKKAAPAAATADGKKAAPAAKGKKEPTEKQMAQRAKLKSCSKDATDKKLKGDERKKFMSNCMKS